MIKKVNWTKILLETGMIVLSVLLALLINEWKREYNYRIETEKMQANIVVEMENNQKFVDNLISYHSSVLENINRAFQNDSLKSTFLDKGYFEIYKVAPNGVIQGGLNNIAWLVAKEDKISNRIELDEAQVLFSVYRQQSKVMETVNRIIKILNSREIHREELIEETVIILAIEFNEVISQEKDLSFKYSQTLKTIKNR